MLFRAGMRIPFAQRFGPRRGRDAPMHFLTGPFLEPIEVWDEPRLLKFGVTANPAPLNEMTPYGHIEPRHLHGILCPSKGSFC